MGNDDDDGDGDATDVQPDRKKNDCGVRVSRFARVATMSRYTVADIGARRDAPLALAPILRTISQ